MLRGEGEFQSNQRKKKDHLYKTIILNNQKMGEGQRFPFKAIVA